MFILLEAWDIFIPFWLLNSTSLQVIANQGWVWNEPPIYYIMESCPGLKYIILNSRVWEGVQIK